MAFSKDLSDLASIANGVYNSISANTTNIVQITVGGASINSTSIAANSATAYANAVSYVDNKVFANTSQLNANIALVQSQIVANSATAYSNAVSYVDNKVYANTDQLNANIALVQSQITANSATAYSNAVSYVDNKVYANTDQLNANIALVQSQITANSATAYTNAVSYVDGKVFANTSQLDANIALVQSQITANSATAYSNAVSYVDGKLYVNTSQLSSNLSNYALLSGAVFTGDVTTNNLTVSGNLTLQGNTVIVGANNLVVNDAVISIHSPANGAPLTTNDGRNIGIAFHYYDTQDEHAALLRDNATGYLVWYSAATDPNSNTNVTGESLGTVQANSFIAGNSTVFTVLNSTSYSGTANNSTNFDGLSLATVQGQITGNAATAYSNAVSYVDNKVYANTDQLNANIALVQSQITANSATAYSNAVSYVDNKVYANTSQLDANIALVQSQITANSATAYTNAVSYVDNKLYVNTSQLSSNLSNYATIIDPTFTNTVTVTGNTILNGRLLANNDIDLKKNGSRLSFTTLSGSSNVFFEHQSDDNFVFYTTNSSNAQRPVFNIYANTNTSTQSGAFRFNTPVDMGSYGVYANNSLGVAGQILTSSGTGVYWSAVAGTGTVTNISTGNGIDGGPITTTGTLSVNTAYIATLAANSATYANASVTNTFTVGTSNYFVANGNVGLGTSSPDTKLQIAGSANVSGNVAVNSNFYSQTTTNKFQAATIAANNNLAIDLAQSNFFTVTLDKNVGSITVTNTPTGVVAFYIIRFDIQGSYSISWPASFKWKDATPPIVSSTVGDTQTFIFYTVDGGTTTQAFNGGNNR